MPLALINGIPRKCPYCKGNMDQRGYHLSNCKKRPTKTQIHNNAIKILEKLLGAGRYIRKEERGQTPATASKRPIDMSFTMDNESGKRKAIDLTIISPYSIASTILFKTNNGFTRMQNVENEKISKLGESVNRSVYDYVPVVITTIGGIGPMAHELFGSKETSSSSSNLSK